ncbi:hypothetical protein CO151_13410 [bacterium CG_4_9_14_3_um_filter_65_15]|nr:MAG: hypothetical protein CO151_13410 [bacterium CG_4_9_14_3_um_filter_65_15]
MATSFLSGKSMALAADRARNRRSSRASLLLCAGLFLLALVVISQLGENGLVSWLRLRSQVSELSRDTDELETANADLEGRIDAVLNDPQTLERLARERHNMKGPGEEVLMILLPGQGRLDPEADRDEPAPQ